MGQVWKRITGNVSLFVLICTVSLSTHDRQDRWAFALPSELDEGAWPLLLLAEVMSINIRCTFYMHPEALAQVRIQNTKQCISFFRLNVPFLLPGCYVDFYWQLVATLSETRNEQSILFFCGVHCWLNQLGFMQ
jgi:hypothetical protein